MMIAFFDPLTLLEQIQLNPEEYEWLLARAKAGNAWTTVTGDRSTAILEVLKPIWLHGPTLWAASSPALRSEHLHPEVPLWENIFLGWAQVRLRDTRTAMNRRDQAWANLLKSFLVGFHPSFPGSADLAFKHGRDRLLQLAEVLGISPLPHETGGTEIPTRYRNFTKLGFGMVLDMLLDPDRDLMVGRVSRVVGLLDRALHHVKSEDLVQARKMLLEIVDAKSLTPGSPSRAKTNVDWLGFRAACNQRFHERQAAGEQVNPTTVAMALECDEEWLRDLLDGRKDDQLEDAERRIWAFLVGEALGVPVGRFLIPTSAPQNY